MPMIQGVHYYIWRVESKYEMETLVDFMLVLAVWAWPFPFMCLHMCIVYMCMVKFTVNSLQWPQSDCTVTHYVVVSGSSLCRLNSASHMAGEMLLQLVTCHPKTIIKSKTLSKLSLWGLMWVSEQYTGHEVSCQRNGWSQFLVFGKKSEYLEKRTTAGLFRTDRNRKKHSNKPLVCCHEPVFANSDIQAALRLKG